MNSPFEPPPPISIEEIENSPNKYLRLRVNEWFAYLAKCGYEQKPGVLAQAEFYMRELERRENAIIAERDFGMATTSHKMEKWVIVLIGIELLVAAGSLVYGVYEGNKQQTVLEQMGSNTGATAGILKTQGEVLDKTNTNTHDTVEAVGKLQSLQNDSLAAQKKTLVSIGKMNEALQKELDLAFAIAIVVTADETKKRIMIQNQTRTAIYIWGAKLDDESPVKFEDERFISPSGGYFFQWEKIFENASATVPKASTGKKVPLEFYLLAADGKPHIARCFLIETWEGDVMKVYATVVSIKQEAWPANVK
jgi:hypothetical protein